MSAGSFNKLTNLIRHALKIDKDMHGQPPRWPNNSQDLSLLLPSISSRGLYPKICLFTGISTASLFHAVWKVVFAINECDALAIVLPTTPEECETTAQGFSYISKEGWISNFVAVYGGDYLEICVQPKKQVGNVIFLCWSLSGARC